MNYQSFNSPPAATANEPPLHFISIKGRPTPLTPRVVQLGKIQQALRDEASRCAELAADYNASGDIEKVLRCADITKQCLALAYLYNDL
jgi:hypothetical protein